MAISKTINFLPEYFQSIPNDRFLSGTLDQLVAAPQISLHIHFWPVNLKL